MKPWLISLGLVLAGVGFLAKNEIEIALLTPLGKWAESRDADGSLLTRTLYSSGGDWLITEEYNRQGKLVSKMISQGNTHNLVIYFDTISGEETSREYN